MNQAQAMTVAEWIAAGAEVLFDDQPEGSVEADLLEVVQKHGVAAIIKALRDASDATMDHLSDPEVPADQATQREVDSFRLSMVNAMTAVRS